MIRTRIADSPTAFPSNLNKRKHNLKHRTEVTLEKGVNCNSPSPQKYRPSTSDSI